MDFQSTVTKLMMVGGGSWFRNVQVHTRQCSPKLEAIRRRLRSFNKLILALESISVTAQKTPVQLHIELAHRDGYKGYDVYNNFSLLGTEDNYRLSV